uniref:Uncharacterized protein n=1 Tax=Colobus angolensis palliatus TaxID=336983 RepID=A0A2K5HU97_COLAP
INRNTETRTKRDRMRERELGTQRPPPSWRQSGRTEGEGTARVPHPGQVEGGPVEQRGHQYTVQKGAGRQGPGLRAPCWPLLPPAGGKREEAAVFRPRTLFIPFAHHPPTTACPTPCPPLHRVPPGPAGGAGVLPVTLLAQSSRAV